MKKLFLICSLSSLFSLNAYEANVWAGAPVAFRQAISDDQVVHALESIGSHIGQLLVLYIKKVAPSLTTEQKKQCAAMLAHAKQMMHKSHELTLKGGDDQKLQEEIQKMGQDLFLSYLPLVLTMQQELTDAVAATIEEEIQQLAGKGYDLLDHALDSMITVLQ